MSSKPGWNLKLAITNFFGALGYFTCSLQWLWAIILYFNYIQSMFMAVSPDPEKPVEIIKIVPPTGDFSPLTIIPIAVIAVSMVAVAIYSIIKMPSAISKVSQKVTQTTAENLAPIIIRAQHKKITKKNRFAMTARLIMEIRVFLIITPIALTYASRFTSEPPIDADIAIIVVTTLASLSALFFVTQYLLSKLKSPGV